MNLYVKPADEFILNKFLLIVIVFSGLTCPVNAQTAKLNEDLVYTIVEEQPKFPGGRDSLMIFVKNRARYPESAIRAKIKGKVYLTFIVEKDGSLSDIQVLNGLGYGCDEEAIRVIQQMPRWEPGKQSGKPLRVKCTLPVSFGLK